MLGLRKCSDIECSVEIIFTYVHGPYTVMWVIFGGANFHEKPVMSLRINFRGLKCQSHVSTWVEMFVGSYLAHGWKCSWVEFFVTCIFVNHEKDKN